LEKEKGIGAPSPLPVSNMDKDRVKLEGIEEPIAQSTVQ
jgi:hypothetical protein